MLLNKVVLGKVYTVGAFGEVNSCPAGFQSVSVITLDRPEYCKLINKFRLFSTDKTASWMKPLYIGMMRFGLCFSLSLAE